MAKVCLKTQWIYIMQNISKITKTRDLTYLNLQMEQFNIVWEN